MGGMGEHHHGVGFGIELQTCIDGMFRGNQGVWHTGFEGKVEKVVVHFEGQTFVFQYKVMISRVCNLQSLFTEKLQSLCHSVGIGEPEVDITAHAQAGNGVEGIEGITLEDGTADAGLEKPGKHLLACLAILALLMAYGLLIAEPLEAQVERGLAVLGKALHAFGHQAQNALLLALQQQGEPLVVGESAEKGGIGLPVPQTAAQQFEQLRKQRGIGGGCFHKDKSKAPVINSGFCACRLPRQRSDACGTRSAGRTGCGPCGSRRV